MFVGEEFVPPFGQGLFDLVAETLTEFHKGKKRREMGKESKVKIE